VTAALERIAKENDGKTVLIVSHGGTIRSLICAWLGYEIKDIKKVCSIRNTAVTIAEYDDGKVSFTLMGDQSHLPEDLK
jgi:broad specificity phosphatase PhoE